MTMKLNKTELKAVEELLSSDIKDGNELMLIKRKLAKKHHIGILENSSILKALNSLSLKPLPEVRRLLRKRSIRTLSGIAPVAVLTEPYECPGKCAYCPTEKNVPQSYLSNEPAVMRAIRCRYDPYVQVRDRLKALVANGHEPTKIELIVIGGTWSVLPEKYKYWYIKECFRGANEFHETGNIKHEAQNAKRKTRNENIDKLKDALKKEQIKNEDAKYRIIGITLETRPDYIDEKELREMRELGCTRVEMGVQAIDDKILKLNKRGHGVGAIARATALLKDFGFKVTYHVMPGLPGSTPAGDIRMFKRLFNDGRFQPDQIKFYPTVVTRGSLLYRWWKQGKYKPYSDKVLRELIIKCKNIVPSYVRIIRLIRDIPGESIVAGNLTTNLRQVMQQRGVKCDCIRCREIKGGKLEIRNPKLEIIKYEASGGQECFIQAISKNKDDRNNLLGFCRLRLSSQNMKHETYDSINDSALVRELHVYGELVPVGKGKKIQHAGLGKKLMAEAEKIARAAGYGKMAVIAGVGVRGYYRKLGYRLKETYMVKNLHF
ncbi:MAG: tRNA uridine(34) 5-carboxymethylaminomethyl modification radical SAM/GNAT enzyme Elp3 [Candidatus Falkowbacteria bacterium]